MAIRNYTPEANWKICWIITREVKLRYKIQFGSIFWKRHADQMTNVGIKVSLVNDTNSEEINIWNFRSEDAIMEHD